MAHDAGTLIARYHAKPSDVPKHARLRAAIAEAVQAGDLRAGTKITSERELSQLLGVSLGTMQKALGRLVADGFLVRRQGHGTFVGRVRQCVAGPWHYRFRDSDGRQLPVFTTLLERRLVTDEGPWVAALGADPAGYVHLRRRLDVDGRFVCASRLYLPATRFGRLLRIAEKRLSDVNLKSVLELDFGAPTLAAEGLAHLVTVDATDACTMGLAPRVCVLQVDIVGSSFGRTPITLQRMIVPPTPYGLVLDFPPPRAPGSGAN